MTQKETLKKIEKNKKRNKVLKTIACAIGWTALLGAFVGVVCLQVKSCKGKKNNGTNTTIIGDFSPKPVVIRSTNNNNGTLVYYETGLPSYEVNNLEYDSETFTTLYDFVDYYINADGDITDSLQGNLFGLPGNIAVHVYDSGNQGQYNIDFIQGRDGVVHTQYYLKSSGITHNNAFGGWHSPYSFETNALLFTSWDSAFEEYDIYEGAFWFGVLYGYNSYNLSSGGTPLNFNAQINRYAPLNMTNDSVVIVGTDYIGTSTIFNGIFTDLNNTIYKAIKIEYGNATGTRYLDNDGRVYTSAVASTRYLGLYYVQLDGTEVLVNQARYSSVNGEVVYNGNSEWLSYVYQNIRIYGSTSLHSGPALNYGLAVLNALNNLSGGDGGGSLTDGFQLIGLAFSSIIALLNYQVLPNITLGTLVFIPFIVIIITTMVWLFKR